MKARLKYIIVGHLILVTFSCQHLKWTRIDGKLKATDKFWRYPSYSTSYKKRGVKIVVDTVDNYLVSKTRYKYSIGCFHHNTIRQKTITYNKKHQRIEKYVFRHGKKKTIEYINNYEKIKISFDSETVQKDSTETKDSK